MKVTLFDYGAGNLHSLGKALAEGSDQVVIEANPVRALETDVLVLPGVGAFASAAERLEPGKAAMRKAIETGLPCLGICLGMQLLFETSEEGPGEGLGHVRSRRFRRDDDDASDTLAGEVPQGVPHGGGLRLRPEGSGFPPRGRATARCRAYA